jgi:hypothetical protein
MILGVSDRSRGMVCWECLSNSCIADNASRIHQQLDGAKQQQLFKLFPSAGVFSIVISVSVRLSDNGHGENMNDRT